MSLLVTGSIGIDTITTPYDSRQQCLGGSAVYFTMAASLFAPVRFVGVVGTDCPFDLAKVFAGRDVDLRGLEIRPESKTFRWAGTYHKDMDDRTTDLLELNVLAEAPPTVPVFFRDSEFVFLANTNPQLQGHLLDQLERPRFIAVDTMDCWIHTHNEDLLKLLKRTDCLIINQQEAQLLANEDNLIAAADKILQMGAKLVLIKRGSAGSLVASRQGWRFLLPAYPVKDLIDPTGAGDSFAGGFLGYLAATGRITRKTLRLAVAYGTVTASFAIEGFSIEGISRITRQDLDQRLDQLRAATRF